MCELSDTSAKFWGPDYDSESFSTYHEYDSGNYFLFSYWAHDHDGLVVNRAQDSFYPSSVQQQPLNHSVSSHRTEASLCKFNNHQTKLRMASNGGSGGDYQAVEANETRRKRINQVA